MNLVQVNAGVFFYESLVYYHEKNETTKERFDKVVDLGTKDLDAVMQKSSSSFL